MLLLISYDPKEAESLLPALQSELERIPRLKVILMPKSPDRIEAVEQGDLLVVLLSPSLTEGHPAWDDIEHAQAIYRDILPILIAPMGLPAPLEGLYHLDLSQNPKAGLRRLSAHLKNRLGIPDNATAPLEGRPSQAQADHLQAFLNRTDPRHQLTAAPSWRPWLLGLALALGILALFLLLALAN
jgi:hypothetical protein